MSTQTRSPKLRNNGLSLIAVGKSQQSRSSALNPGQGRLIEDVACMATPTHLNDWMDKNQYQQCTLRISNNFYAVSHFSKRWMTTFSPLKQTSNKKKITINRINFNWNLKQIWAAINLRNGKQWNHEDNFYCVSLLSWTDISTENTWGRRHFKHSVSDISAYNKIILLVLIWFFLLKNYKKIFEG